MFSYRLRRQSGFTLIELMVVVVIIAILSGIATTSFLSAQRNARDTNRKTQVNTVSNAIESFYRVKLRFPGQTGAGTAPGYAAEVAGCETYDPTTDGFVYAYYPTLQSAVTGSQRPCYNRNGGAPDVSGSYTFTPSNYQPFPTWIPELGEYLNPAPQEKQYQGLGGSLTGTYDVNNDPFRPNTTNIMRTFAYRKLDGGYIVYTELENDSADALQLDNTKTPPQYDFPGSPNFPNGTPVIVYSKQVYAIRK